MKVILAGYNLDSEVVEELKNGTGTKANVTPEVLSASYARISRDPRPIDELRGIARTEVEKARKSNSAIIFKMGHHSVAEHAVFNFDIIGVTRLALEELEKFRLCSYTEKSQRYQKLEDNYLVPEEIASSNLKDLFVETLEAQNSLYQEMVKEKIEPEDARYITSLATKGQVGMTLNARNLELLFRRFASNPLKEVQDLGRELYKQVKDLAPSIILFTEANPHDRDTYNQLKAETKKQKLSTKDKNQEVKLVDYSKFADEKLVAAILHTTSNSPYETCLKAAKKMPKKQKELLIKTSQKNMEFYDATIREYEFVGLTYELIVSAACFGQLKRHRMASLTAQAYDPSLGVVIPKAIKESKLIKKYLAVIKQTEKAFAQLNKISPSAAQYVLTNSHARRVLFLTNARELYHISRLREDQHAQWDIQNISRKMSEEAKKVMPLAMLTIGGKDSYTEIYEKVFGVMPKIVPQY